ncbi:MAG: hypothetical protein A2Z25_17975 [Planctomycetes bacterium RBG_16_55_9]|nr:MAG: hypothetical protein A2Z25_17975 [Planctomycetes bacterium RBG_16_55_9]
MAVETMLKLEEQDFARAFGIDVEELPEECKVLIAEKDFGYEVLEGPERDKVILDVLKRIDSDRQVVGADERQAVWDKGWTDNLKDFIESGYSLDKLIPRFIRPNQIIRFNGNYIRLSNPNFELDFYSIYRLWLFKEYFQEFDAVYEFGCGTGFNLVALAQLYPEKRLHGLDFVRSSVELVNKIGEAYEWNITGHLFDMLSPDESLRIEPESAVFTIGAVEQLAGRFEPFLQWLLDQSPALCVHVEPTIELYDETRLFDYLAAKFHRKRGYTQGYLTRLRELESRNEVQILQVKRPFFGSLFMEGYALTVWKPCHV